MTRYASLTILLVNLLIRQLRSFMKDGTSAADCLYLTKKLVVVLEPEYTLLQFSALHERVHPTSWPTILFLFYAGLQLKCCFWDLDHFTGFSWLHSIHFDILCNTISE
jgi:hypothetical protein